MLKQNKGKLLLSSAIVLLPILIGLLLWDRLPEQMATHWGPGGTADGWSSRPVAVLALPCFLLVLHWVCLICTTWDPKNKDQNARVMGLIYWICPMISLAGSGLTYATALGAEFSLTSVTPLILGILLVALGNYLPKCKQNHTVGIRLKWTLENEENWNATHRFTGKFFVAGGLVLLACSFFPEGLLVSLIVILPVVLVGAPVLYSYRYHKKQLREGTLVVTPLPRKAWIPCLVILLVTALFCGLLLFTGSIEVTFGADAFTVEASCWSDLTVDYAAVDSIEYRDSDVPGSRTNGYGSSRLLAGAFRNDEFGNYTRYSYTQCDACIVLKADGKILVLNAPNAQATKALYEAIQTQIQ